MNRLARFAGFGGKSGEVDRDDAPVGSESDDRATGASGAVSDASTEMTSEQLDAEALQEAIVAELRKVHDPEIPINIYDLGLIYRIDIRDDLDVDIDMTLTAPACPVAGMMPIMVRDAAKRVPGLGEVRVQLVWDPPWTQEKMSEEALLQLGML